MDFRLNLVPAGMLAVALFAVPAIADTVTDDGAMTHGCIMARAIQTPP